MNFSFIVILVTLTLTGVCLDVTVSTSRIKCVQHCHQGTITLWPGFRSKYVTCCDDSLPLQADSNTTQIETEVKDPSSLIGPNTTTADPIPVAEGQPAPISFDSMYSPEHITAPDEVFAREQLITRLTWASTDAHGAELTGGGLGIASSLLHLTTNTFAVNNPAARMLAAYASFKADIEVTAWVNGNANCAGLLQLAVRTDRATPTTTLYNACCDPFKSFLSPQSNEKIKILIPYKSPYWRRMGNSAHNPWGVFLIHVVNPLVSASVASVPPIQISISARFVNVKLQGPTTIAYQSAKSFVKEAQSLAKTGVAVLKDTVPGAKATINILKTVGRVFAPELVDIAESWGFSKPSLLTPIVRNKPTPTIPFYNKGYSPDFMAGIQEDASCKQFPDPLSQNYADYDVYGSMLSFNRKFSANTTTVTDNIISAIPVSPFVGPITSSSPNSSMACGPLQWLAQSHSMWRGALAYRIFVSAPIGVTGTLRVSHIPEGWLALPATVESEDAGDIASVTLDFKGDTVFDFVVPASNFVPAFSMPKNPVNPVWRGYNCNGFLSFSLVNKINNPFGIDTTVNFAVYMAAVPGFEWYGDVNTGFVHQSAMVDLSSPKPIVPADIVETDGLLSVQRFKSWKDKFMMPRALLSGTTRVISPVIGSHPLESKTFTFFRGSRINLEFCTAGCTLLTTLWSRRTGGDLAINTSNVLWNTPQDYLYIGLPYTANVPYLSFVIEPRISDLISGELYTTLALSAVSNTFGYGYAGDDCQWFVPTFCSNITLADAFGPE